MILRMKTRYDFRFLATMPESIDNILTVPELLENNNKSLTYNKHILAPM